MRRVPTRRYRTDGQLYYLRFCPDCGRLYRAHIKNKRCPVCQAAADKLHALECRRRMAAGKSRSIGSTDLCVVCGNPYTVKSGKQMYCPSCAEQATRERIREHKRAYYHDHYTRDKLDAKNAKRRKDWRSEIRQCLVCGKPFNPDTPRQVCCSMDCRHVRDKEIQRRSEEKRKEKRRASKNGL